MVEGSWTSRAATTLLTSLLALLALAASVLVLPDSAYAGPLHHRRDKDADPLRISLTSLAPGVLPDHGPIQVGGTLTNDDTVPWENIALYPTIDSDSCVAASTCSAPLTTSQELADGAASDADSPVAERIVEEQVKQTVERLDPGESVSFSITVPRAVLRQYVAHPQAGIYWFGVQAIGESSSTPRDKLADGRARTFLPYVPPSYTESRPGHAPQQVRTAIVVPIRTAIRHLRDGRVAGVRDWLQSLSGGGALASALGMGVSAGAAPVTWLVDPAVPDAVEQLAEGNPPRLLPAPGEASTSSASSSVSNGPDAGSRGSSSGGPLATAASDWLDQARRLFGGGQLLTLPYGDTELIGTHQTGRLYSWGRSQKGLLSEWKLPARRVISSPDGYVDPAGLDAVPDHSLVLVGDQALRRPVAGGTLGDHPFATMSSGTASGGPDPADRLSAVAVRQRILSEAAVRLLSGSHQPLIAQLPDGITDPGELWAQVQQPWLHLTTVGGVLGEGHATMDTDRLRYPAAEATDEMPAYLQGQALQLAAAGSLLQSILTPAHNANSSDAPNAHLADSVRAEALAGTSYSLRGDDEAGARLDRSRIWLDEQLAGVTISAPPGVTLSSSAGSFAVTVINDLDVPVTVGIEADATGARLSKTDPVQLAPHSRASVRLDAHTSREGVHNVRLLLTDPQGTPIGASVTVPVRSGTVGVVIWVILGTGAGILFFAIAVRLVRRLRRRTGAEA